MHGLTGIAKASLVAVWALIAAAIILVGQPPVAVAASAPRVALSDPFIAPLLPREQMRRHKRKVRLRWDIDGDGLSNWVERRRTRTNPRRRDTDRDGLQDRVELKRTRTNPRRADTDGDGVKDGAEVRAGSNPRDPASFPGATPEAAAAAPSPDPAPVPPATGETRREEEPPPPPVDTTPPAVSVDSGPDGLTNDPSPVFGFSAEAGAALECSIGEGTPDFGACSGEGSHGPAEPLADGAHTFRVRAGDAAGNQAVAARGFEVDATAPETTIDNGPGALTNSASATLAFSGSDPGGSGVASFQCNLDEAGFGACASAVELTELTDGTHSFEVRAIDEAGNVDGSPAKHAWTVDLTVPAASIDSLSKALLKAGESSEVSWHVGENGSFELRVGECDTGAVVDSGAYGAQPAAHVSAVTAAQLAEGPNTLRLCLTDAAGNRGEATTTIERDTVAPQTAIALKPDPLTNSTTAEFGFTGSDPGGSGLAFLECRLDGGAWMTCSSPLEYTALAEGPHTFSVRATDAAGNQASAIREFEVDPAALPAPVLVSTTPASPANENAPLLFGSAPAGATVQLFAGTSCTGSPLATFSQAELEAGLAIAVTDDSTNVLRANATEAERTSGCSEPLAYVEDSSPPATTIASSPPAGTYSTSASFFVTVNESAPSQECSLDGAAFAACKSPWSYADLAPGEHSFAARATDTAGNVEAAPAEWAWTIEPPPTAPSACPGGLEAATAAAVRSAVEAGEDVCVTGDVGDVDLSDLGSRPVVVSTAGGSVRDVDLGSTTDLTISQARLETVELRNSHRTHLLGNTIGGTEAEPALDQAIFMPDDNDDVLIEDNEIGWMIADNSGNTGYGCRCYGDLDRLRFVGNRLHDLGADGFQGVGGVDVLIDRNEIGPVGRNPGSDEHSDNIQITGNEANLRITNNWIHHQGYWAGEITANAGSTYIHGGSTGSLVFANNLIETTQGRTEICGLGTGGSERSNLTITRNTWVDGGLAFSGFPSFEWDCDSGANNKITRNVAIDPDGGFADNGYDAAIVAPNIFGDLPLATLDADGNCTSANCNPSGEEPIGYRKPTGVKW